MLRNIRVYNNIIKRNSSNNNNYAKKTSNNTFMNKYCSENIYQFVPSMLTHVNRKYNNNLSTEQSLCTFLSQHKNDQHLDKLTDVYTFYCKYRGDYIKYVNKIF